MKPSNRHRWLLAWITTHRFADVLDAELVNDYVRATGARSTPTTLGADRCPQLGRDLAHMHRIGLLTRHTASLAGAWQPGFPTWVWCYETNGAARSGPNKPKESHLGST